MKTGNWITKQESMPVFVLNNCVRKTWGGYKAMNNPANMKGLDDAGFMFLSGVVQAQQADAVARVGVIAPDRNPGNTARGCFGPNDPIYAHWESL
jgi:hypothetical protein